MPWLKQHASKNLFTLLLSSSLAIAAGFYSGMFQHPTICEATLWVTITFITCSIATYFTVTYIRKIHAPATKIFSYLLYTTTIILITGVFIFPAAFLLTGPIVEDNKHSICCETPLEYGATNYQTVKFTMKDGITISGWYIPPSTHKNSLIILIHGHYTDRRATREWAKHLIKAGYGIYMYDLRGHGESEGVLDYIHSDFAVDLLEVRKQLGTTYPIKKFGAVGLSMGAHALINAISQNSTAFQYAWLDGLWPQAPKDVDVFHHEVWMYTNFDWVTQIIFKDPALKVRSLFDILTENKTTKIMVVAAGAEGGETSAGRKLATVKNDLVNNWIIPGALHLNGISVAPDEYKQKLLTFFKTIQD